MKQVWVKRRECNSQHIADIEYAILKHLGSPKDIQAALAILLSELAQVATDAELSESPWLKDKLLSYGERMSSLLFSEVLRQSGISAVNADVTQVYGRRKLWCCSSRH